MSSKTASKKNNRNFIECIVDRIDDFQKNNRPVSVIFALFKKYSDDNGGHLAALVTYYGFLSLFPLLIVASVVVQLVAADSPGLKDQLISSITSYFPAIGPSLTESIHLPSKSGVALLFALIIMFYGARGAAMAIQNTLHTAWAVPRKKRKGFPIATLHSLVMILFAGLGLLLAALLTGYATNSDYSFVIKTFLGTGGFIILFGVFWGVFTFGSSARRRPIANIPGALISAVGILFLQAIGSYLVTNQLSRFNGLTAQFGVILVLLFWIYLQAQIIIYALEYNTVKAHKLFPRSIRDDNPTPADLKAYELYKQRDSFLTKD